MRNRRLVWIAAGALGALVLAFMLIYVNVKTHEVRQEDGPAIGEQLRQWVGGLRDKLPKLSLGTSEASAAPLSGHTYGDKRSIWKTVPVKAAAAGITKTGSQTVDGVSCTDGDHVLSTTDAAVYVVQSGAWTLRDDFTSSAWYPVGTVIYITSGTANGGKWGIKTGASTWEVKDLDAGVTGAASSTDNAAMRWDGTGGETAQNSVVIISDAGATSGITTLAASGIVDLGGTTQGILDLNEASANGANYTRIQSSAALSGDRTIAAESIIVGALGASDNALLRSDGVGGLTAQGAGIIIDDSDNVSAMGTLSCGAITSDGTLLLGGTAVGRLEFENVGSTFSHAFVVTPATADRTISVPDANVTLADIALNTTHRSSDGSDHTFIDQDVTSGSTPTFTGTNFTGIPDGALSANVFLADGTVAMTGALDVGSQGLTNAGAIAGATTVGCGAITSDGTLLLGGTAVGRLEFENVGSTFSQSFVVTPATADRTISVPDANVTLADIALNTTHRSSNGSDHTFIDQSVISGSTPTFTGTNFTGIPDGALSANVFLADGTVAMTGALDVGSQGLTNTGAIAGATTVGCGAITSDGTLLLGGTAVGRLEFENVGSTFSQSFVVTPATADRTISVPDANVTLADIALNTTHRSSDGSDHTFIDQDVTSGSTPTLTGTNFSGVPDGALSANVFLADGTVAMTAALNAGNQGLTNAGAIAGATTIAATGKLSLGTSSEFNPEDATGSATIKLAEDTDNGILTGTLTVASNITVARTYTFGDLDLTFDQSVASGSSPTLDATNITGLDEGAVRTALAASTGTLALNSQTITSVGAVDGVDISAIKLDAMPSAASGGNIDCGTGAITNVGLVDGVDVSAVDDDDTDYQIHVPLLGAVGDAGTWTPAVTSGGLVTLTRTTNNAVESAWVEVPIPNRTSASKGIKPTGLTVNYTVNTGACDDIRVEVWAVTQGADGAARTAAVLFGEDNLDYEADHNTAVERCDNTGAPELHQMTITDAGTPAFLAADKALLVRLYVDGGAASTEAFTSVILNYTGNYVDGS